MAQRVLITAGARGIGKEVANARAAVAAHVCVCDIDAKAFDVGEGHSRSAYDRLRCVEA